MSGRGCNAGLVECSTPGAIDHRAPDEDVEGSVTVAMAIVGSRPCCGEPGGQRGAHLPQKQPKRGRLWSVRTTSGLTTSCTHAGGLSVVDGHRGTHVWLSRWPGFDPTMSCSYWPSVRSPRSARAADNGPEFCAQALRDWGVGVKTLYIQPGCFNGKSRVARPGDLLHLAGSEGVNRAVEAQGRVLLVMSTGAGDHGNPAAARLPPDLGTPLNTYELVQSLGAGHHPCRFRKELRR